MTSPLSIEQEADALEDSGYRTVCIIMDPNDESVVLASGYGKDNREAYAAAHEDYASHSHPTIATKIRVYRVASDPLIRALRERVVSLEYDVAYAKDEAKTWSEKYYDPERNPYWSQQQARIESLEAELELEYERANEISEAFAMDYACDAADRAQAKQSLPRFSPSEIAARVAERKARTP